MERSGLGEVGLGVLLHGGDDRPTDEEEEEVILQ